MAHQLPQAAVYSDTFPLDVVLRHMRIANGDELGATGVLLKLACASKAHRDKVVRWSRRKARETGEKSAAVRAALARTAAFWNAGRLYDHEGDGEVVGSALAYAGYFGTQRGFVRACVALNVRPACVASRMRTLKTRFDASPDDGFRVGAAVESGAFDADFRVPGFLEAPDTPDGAQESWRMRDKKTRFAWNLAVACENLPPPGSVTRMLQDPGLTAFVERAARDDRDGCAPPRLKLWLAECRGAVVGRMASLSLVRRTRPGTFARKHLRERADLTEVHSRLRGR